MSFRNLGFLVLLLIGLGGYLYFVELPNAEQAERAKKLYGVDGQSIDRLRLEYADVAIDLQRVDDGWEMTAPVSARANGSAVDNLVASLADGEVAKDLGAVETDGDAFGLEAPLVKVSPGTTDGPLATLAVGNAAPVGAVAYIQKLGEPNVLLTSTSLRNALDKKVEDLRDKKLLALDSDEVQWFESSSAKRDIRFRRETGNDDDVWHAERPSEARGDASAIRTFLSSLESLSALEFVDEEPSALDAYGLDQPRLVVRLGVGDEKVTEVRIGAEKTDSEIYAQTSERNTVYTIADWALRNIDKSARDLRDKTLLAFAVDDVRAIHVVSQDNDDYKLTRTGDRWSIAGVTGVAKQDAITDFVGDLQDLKGYEIVADDPTDLSLYGLDEPMLQITLFGEADATIGSIIVAKTVEEDGIHNFNATTNDAEMVVRLRSYLFNRINKKATDLVDAPQEAESDTGDVGQ